MDGLLIIIGLLAVAVVVTGWRFFQQLKRRRLMAGLFWSLQSALVICAFMVVLLVYSNLHTYHRLTYERVIADVYIRRIAAQQFQVLLSLSDNDDDQRYFEVHGDQWQLDARILKWKGWANLIGLDSYYQLERLSGRYSHAQQAREMVPSVFDLVPQSSGLDLWKLKALLRDKVVFVDTLFGQGVFMPMQDGAHYQVSIGQSGLVTRPVNEVAKEAVLK